MDLPAPDHPLGHTEAQVRALLGDEYVRFSEHMLMKATARDENEFVFYEWICGGTSRRIMRGIPSGRPVRKDHDDQDHHVPASR